MDLNRCRPLDCGYFSGRIADPWEDTVLVAPGDWLWSMVNEMAVSRVWSKKKTWKPIYIQPTILLQRLAAAAQQYKHVQHSAKIFTSMFAHSVTLFTRVSRKYLILAAVLIALTSASVIVLLKNSYSLFLNATYFNLAQSVINLRLGFSVSIRYVLADLAS